MSAQTSASDLPPVPDRRWITPAPEDYVQRAPLAGWTWPVLWLGAIVLLAVLCLGAGWH